MNIHVRYAGDWTELAALKPGALFETQDGLRFVLTNNHGIGTRQATALPDGKTVWLNHDRRVREIQLRDVKPEAA